MNKPKISVVGDYLPNEATFQTVLDITTKLNESFPGISTRIEAIYAIEYKWRFLISFAWEGKEFCSITYGYGAGEIETGRSDICVIELDREPVIFDTQTLLPLVYEGLMSTIHKAENRIRELRIKINKNCASLK